MGILLNILSDSAFDRMDSKRFIKAPYVIEKSALAPEAYTMYKYALQSAQRYPKKWIENHLGARVILTFNIENNAIKNSKINILTKSNLLSDEEIYNEVQKTMDLAFAGQKNLVNSNGNVNIELSWM